MVIMMMTMDNDYHLCKQNVGIILPQLQQMVPETADSASVCRHQFQTASSRNQDDCDTSLLHSRACQPASSK